MADRQFEDARTAALYDPLCGVEERADLGFYLPMVLGAGAVLDVGCGTGALLRWARERGHTGRLVGLDPAEGMLAIASTRADIEWIRGDLSSTSFRREFDLVVMTGHAFQVFVEDDELRTSLAAIRAALDDDGIFAFETRNPFARRWEDWTNGYHEDFFDVDGTPARFTADVELPVTGDLVRFTSSYQRADWDEPAYSESTLRFLDVDELAAFLVEASLVISEQYGDWDRRPVAASSPEIITLARPG